MIINLHINWENRKEGNQPPFNVICRKIGYYGVFSFSAVLVLIGMLFCIYGVEEGPRPESATKSEKGEKEEKQAESAKDINLVLDFFNWRDFGKIFKVLTRKRTDRKRLMLWLSYFLIFFGFGPFFGETELISAGM